jgi:hypothetical protein
VGDRLAAEAPRMSTRALRGMRPGAHDLSLVSGGLPAQTRFPAQTRVSGGDAARSRGREEAAIQDTRRGHTTALAVTGGVNTSAAILVAAVFAVLGGARADHSPSSGSSSGSGPAGHPSGVHGPRACAIAAPVGHARAPTTALPATHAAQGSQAPARSGGARQAGQQPAEWVKMTWQARLPAKITKCGNLVISARPCLLPYHHDPDVSGQSPPGQGFINRLRKARGPRTPDPAVQH